MEDTHEYFIDYLRIVACTLIVCLHVTSYKSDLFNSLAFSNHLNFLIRCGVPIFFIISGYALMKRYAVEQIEYKQFIIKRFARVIIPYLAISTLTITSRLFIEKYKIIPLTDTVYSPFSLGKVVVDLLFAGAAQHYYFLISIFIIYCFFPLLKKSLKNRFYCLLIFISYLILYPFIIKIYDSLELPLPSPDVFSHALWGFKFFLFGVILYGYDRHFRRVLNRYGFLLSLLIISLSLFMNANRLPYSSYALITSYFCLSYYLGKFKPTILIPLGKLTFGVYLFHQPYFVKASTIICAKIGLGDWPLIMSSILLTVTSTALFILVLRRIKIMKTIFLGER